MLKCYIQKKIKIDTLNKSSGFKFQLRLSIAFTNFFFVFKTIVSKIFKKNKLIDPINPWVFWPKTRKKSGKKIISKRKN